MHHVWELRSLGRFKLCNKSVTVFWIRMQYNWFTFKLGQSGQKQVNIFNFWLSISFWKWYCFWFTLFGTVNSFLRIYFYVSIFSYFIWLYFFTKSCFHVQATSVKAFFVKAALTVASNLKSNTPVLNMIHLNLPYMYNVLFLLMSLSNL